MNFVFKLIISTLMFLNVSSVSAAGLPDMVMISAVGFIPERPVSGQKVQFKASIANIGTAATPVNTPICLRIDVDQVTNINFCTDGTPIRPNGTLTMTAPAPSWTVTSGKHGFLAAINRPQNFVESVSTNNAWGSEVTFSDDPSFKITQRWFTSPRVTGNDQVWWGGNCQRGFPIDVTGADTATIQCGTDGTWGYGVTKRTTDGQYTYNFSQKNGFGTTTTVTAVWKRETESCKHFHPGHYLMIDDKNTQGLMAIDQILRFDMSSIAGFGFNLTWKQLAPKATAPVSDEDYDFSRIDSMIRKIKAYDSSSLNTTGAKLNYTLRFDVFDRSFWGCNESYFPPYLTVDTPVDHPKLCFVEIWDPIMMDHEINAIVATVKRYKHDPRFVGIVLAETAMDSTPKQENAYRAMDAMKVQLKRLYQKVSAAAPGISITQQINWNTKAFHEELADSLESLGGGGGLGWPDTVVLPGYRNAYGTNDSWYDIAKRRNKKLLVAPDVQTAEVYYFDRETPQEKQFQDVFNYLVSSEGVGAHMISWPIWYSMSYKKNFVKDFLIPFLNKPENKNRFTNTACPFQK